MLTRIAHWKDQRGEKEQCCQKMKRDTFGAFFIFLRKWVTQKIIKSFFSENFGFGMEAAKI